MKQETRRGLTKIALALALAGYCAVPAIAANESGGNLKGAADWTSESGSTGTLQGTVPWINRIGDVLTETSDKDHVKVTIDRHGRPGDTSSATYRQLHVGDTLTVSWGIGDTQGDIDGEDGSKNVTTKATIQWMTFSDQNGSDGTEVGDVGSDSYTITAADMDKYIGLKITPKTTTGDPNIGTEITLNDLSTNKGGGGDDDNDDIPEGPVVDDNLHVVIHEKGSNTNLLKNSGITLKTGTTYQVLLWSDKNGNSTYDAGEDVTSNYDYRWRFTGNSKQLGAAGGLANPSTNSAELVIPVTNAEAKTAFDYTGTGGITIGADGIQGYGLSIDYKRK
ncbi:SinI family autotransporter-associated protein [Escherichia coli]|uniref:SinI family autotransporter-associated protein n=1 Tax=Escherichia coli TaxID=562 RepID=UPI0015C444F8|nr:SinI family autotransporter-associated protein [Escherichia coli]EIG2127457.1 hypothetical protein [Escherichia coli]NWP58407.1 hypothetical protein [Escherichia coli]QMJ64701.1 hypothetical protein HVX93_06100 [Escherichia coli]